MIVTRTQGLDLIHLLDFARDWATVTNNRELVVRSIAYQDLLGRSCERAAVFDVADMIPAILEELIELMGIAQFEAGSRDESTWAQRAFNHRLWLESELFKLTGIPAPTHPRAQEDFRRNQPKG